LQKSIVLVVDKFSQDVHLAYSTAGVKCPVVYNQTTRRVEYTSGFFSILADLANVHSGVRVFFYRRRIDEPPEMRGFLGEWEATAIPYVDYSSHLTYETLQILGSCSLCGSPTSSLRDDTPVCSACGAMLPGHILPLRFPFSPVQPYPRYLDDNTAYIDITDAGRLSTLIFRKITGAGRGRSVNPILPEESDKLRRLLTRVANSSTNGMVNFPQSTHAPPAGTPITTFLDFQQQYPLHQRGSSWLFDQNSGILHYETILEFWLISTLSSQPQQIVNAFELSPNEDIEWFSNQILFGIGGEKSDVLILMRDRNSGLRCRAIVVELKREAVDSRSLTQVKGYSYWIAQLATAQIQAQSPFVITPIAIGCRVARGVQPFASFALTIPYSQPLKVQVESPRVYTYAVDPTHNTLVLQRQI